MTTAEQPAATAERVPVDLTWADMKYTVQVKGEDGKMHGKELLKGISGTARNSRTLAVMGPSGAGKSTFLNGICGRLALGKDMKLSGTAYLNNSVFLSRYKQLVSYVAQDDIVMGKDTPREALKFSYRLRQGASSEEADEAVTLMLEKLKLTAAADTLLGIPGMLKGVSGGEKKRTNIGAELITNPMILLLDEPTTGLDSVNALRVGNLLRDLAHDEQRTVICTIHTPSSELYDVFDDVLLLAKGWVVYHGACKDAPAYFEKLGYAVPHRMNPSEYFMKLLQLPEVELKKLVDSWLDYAASPASRNNLSINRTPARQDVTMGHEAFDKVAKEKAVGIFGELFLLTGRAWRGTVRDPGSTFGRLIQTLFFSVLLALLYANLTEDDNGVQDRAGLLFMMTMNLVFMNVMNAVAIFPPERAVFLMEQTSGMYRAAMYYFAKVLAELPVIIIFPFIYVIITYWSWGLAPGATAFFNHLAIAQVAAYTGNAFGLFAASLFPRPEITLTVVPLMIMPMMLVGGLFANTERLEPYWVWLNYISFPRYIYKALMINEFYHIDGLNGVRFQSGQDALKYYGFDKDTVDTVWFNIVLLLVMMIVLRIFGALGLHVQGAMRRSELVFEGNYRANSKNHTNDAIQMAEREPEQQARAQPAAAEAGAGATKAATPKGDGQVEHDPSRVQGADE